MTNKEYVDGVLRTESPITPELVERFKNTNTLEHLFEMMRLSIEVGEELDKLKKHLYYGRALLETEIGRVSGVPFDACLRAADPRTIRLLHAVIGMTTEANEMLLALSKHIVQGAPMDTVNLIEEAGDQFWYLGLLSDALQSSFDDIETRNNRKLKKRYPEKFTEAEALNRNLEAERETLEKT